MFFFCIIMTFTVSIVTNIHTWPDPSFDCIQHTLGSKKNILMMEIVTWNIPLSNAIMVWLKTGYWEFDFEAMCPTLDHDLLSQAVYIYICSHLRHWQNLVKSMGRSLQVQIVNYLSILSLESSMDAQNNQFMHTIKVFVLQKFIVAVFLNIF